ncbi:MAG: type II toxin-antitoxin system death-on-curing family toxin [Gemmatimonadetes bacterium]|nr:type II toxin-antitoxin system death-on-curing family toxin [Gemmatimonadota bacterium]MXX71269.1 type II toxin-antitoxin system death-on-curing family toxin [Gemmatimonadota bacterium]MYC93219.1 type II toxin-antitoxin system death-on-curing family toxin [Gemmatimonadota bacterium]MYG36223.1 type II toxin-antitoxin system death-on-curing family toxin [Gemmatimonadota bacterium]MYJ16949.1 type II toxin-antitoxin system death-on-curing family toxin [Gemmatimonadota bacterium]
MTPQEPRWLSPLVVEAVHLDQVREHGGLIGIRDENALESGLARARQRWSYEPDSDLSRLAAGYAFGICTNHPFRDGNKRISFLAAVVFLGLNGCDLVASDEEVVEKMTAVASGWLGEEEIADWIRSRIEPRAAV